MPEKIKRMKPSTYVLRELYIKSGNQCAFPGCYNPMIDENGNFIGQVCHIEAAKAGGERFNSNMTNDERRSIDNLMLLCYEHHIVTNDVNKFPVAILKQMKKDHEAKFSSVIQRMKNSIIDYGIADKHRNVISCNKLSDVLGYGCTEEENQHNSYILNKIIEKLQDIPVETRLLLAIMINRSFNDDYRGCLVPLHEIEAATGKDSAYLLNHIEILHRRRIISEPEIDDYGRPFCKLFGDFESGWDYWNDIRDFCKLTGISINTVCVDLDLSIFDY